MPLKRLLLIFVLTGLALHAAAANRFVEAGAPAPDKEWSGEDYRTFAALLRDGKITLPTLADADGRAMLERLWSTDNLRFARRTDLSLQTRLKESTAISQSFYSILLVFA